MCVIAHLGFCENMFIFEKNTQMKTCIVCGNTHERKASTCSRSCSAKIANAEKSKQAVLYWWNEMIKKHGSVLAFPDKIPGKMNEMFIVVCSIHGAITTCLSNMKSWIGSCPKCNDGKLPIVDGKKQCGTCKTFKTFDQFKLDKGRIKFRCIECDRLDDKLRNQTQKRKEQNKQKLDRYKQKQFEAGLLFFKTDIRYVVCPICNSASVKRGRIDKAKYCSIDCKRKGMTGFVRKTKDSVCPKCGMQHKAKSLNTTCSKCNKEIYKAYQKAARKKRDYKLKIATVHPVIDRKVFERDKWKCVHCGIKVQKVNIYADNAAELDHIVPLSIGGPHSYSNVQTLCRKCNASKSNNYKGQLCLSI